MGLIQDCGSVHDEQTLADSMQALVHILLRFTKISNHIIDLGH